MTSPSRLSRESTTRSSMLPQNGQRIRAPYITARSIARRLRLQIAQPDGGRREEDQSRDENRHGADDVKHQRRGDRRVDVVSVKRRQDQLTDLVKSADAARRWDRQAHRRDGAD